MKGITKGIIRGKLIEGYKDASVRTLTEMAREGYHAVIEEGELVGMEYYKENGHDEE